MSDSPIRMEGVSHWFGSVEVLNDLWLEARRGEFLAVVGPSGCGKTTLLGILAGSLPPTTGSVHREGQSRTIYQHGGLFPWLTVRQNIGMGAEDLASEVDRALETSEMLEMIRLGGFESSYPHQLSGGMRQRVELARAMAGHTDVLLMDEPFSALDYQTRLRMRRELVRMLDQRPRTVVFVTHDIGEAAQLADRIVVLSERPARVQREMSLSTPRPRALTHPAVVRAVEEILEELGLSEEAELEAGALAVGVTA